MLATPRHVFLLNCKRTTHNSTAIAGFLMSDLQRSITHFQVVVAAHPTNPRLADHTAILNFWHDIVANTSRRHCSKYLQQSWMTAVQSGECAIQRWLSSASQLAPPRIRTRTDSDARSLVRFCEQVGKLDPRCDVQSEVASKQAMIAEHRRRLHKLSSGSSPPTIIAPNTISLQKINATSLFITRPTLCQLVNKRTANTSSSILPWAAFRAAAKLGGPHLELIHAALECTWACAEMDVDGLKVELTHLHKGKQKPVDKNASFRPLGLAHPLTSLRSDILRLRIGIGLACTGGAAQLGLARPSTGSHCQAGGSCPQAAYGSTQL